jgi:hypothetical protein
MVRQTTVTRHHREFCEVCHQDRALRLSRLHLLGACESVLWACGYSGFQKYPLSIPTQVRCPRSIFLPKMRHSLFS